MRIRVWCEEGCWKLQIGTFFLVVGLEHIRLAVGQGSIEIS